MSLRIGLVANLDASESVHSATFRRAVAFASQTTHPESGAVTWVLYDDHACAEGGARAARAFREEGVDVVVGHYASDSALAAGPIYAEAGVPYLLPAATADELLDLCPTAHRVCLPDRILSAAIARYLVRRSSSEIAFEHDGSVHGASLTRTLARNWTAMRGRRGQATEQISAYVYSGRFEASVERVHALRNAGFGEWIYLTDDALHPSLPQRLGEAGYRCAVFGFAPASTFSQARGFCASYRQRWSEEPGTYFAETIAALQIALSLPAGSKQCALTLLATRPFRTAMGVIHFERRQGYAGKHALYHVDGPNGLSPSLLPLTIPKRALHA